MSSPDASPAPERGIVREATTIDFFYSGPAAVVDIPKANTNTSPKTIDADTTTPTDIDVDDKKENPQDDDDDAKTITPKDQQDVDGQEDIAQRRPSPEKTLNPDEASITEGESSSIVYEEESSGWRKKRLGRGSSPKKGKTPALERGETWMGCSSQGDYSGYNNEREKKSIFSGIRDGVGRVFGRRGKDKAKVQDEQAGPDNSTAEERVRSGPDGPDMGPDVADKDAGNKYYSDSNEYLVSTSRKKPSRCVAWWISKPRWMKSSRNRN